MEMLWRDIRFGLRMLARHRGFTAVAVLTLALGIGANTAIFSVVSAVLLEPLPYPEGDRLAIAVRKTPGSMATIASYPDFADWQQSGVFATSAAVVGRGYHLDTSEGPQPLAGRRVTAEFFDVLGVRPRLGRAFLPEEVRAGESVAVISHQLWSAHLGGDPAIVGKDLRLRDQTFRVVGVLPPDFLDPLTMTVRAVYTPLVPSADERSEGGRNSQWLQVIGRLASGRTLADARAEVETISERAQRQVRDVRALAPFTLVTLAEYHVGSVKPMLWLLLGAVGFVLLIGCANISNFLLARSMARRHELAVRAAIGASARRLAAQLMTESLLLSVMGGALALLIAMWTIDLVKMVSPVSIPRLETSGFDLRVFGFTVLVTCLAALLFGLLPMLRGSRQDVAASLKQGAGTGDVERARSRGALLVAEVALTTILLVGAILTTASFRRLLHVDTGFRTDGVLAMDFGYAGQWQHPQQWSFFDRLLARVRALPGVRAAGVVDNLPFSGSWSQFTTEVEDFTSSAAPAMQGKTIEYQQGVIGGDYFRAMSIPLIAGRSFDERDAGPSAASVIVSESLARRLWGDADPLGQAVSDGQTRGARVVGVVSDVRHFGPDSQRLPTLYRPLAQRLSWGGALVVLAEGDPAALASAIRQAARTIDGSVVSQRVRTMDDLLGVTTAMPRFLAVLLGSFGALALALAVIGVYGVLAYSVSQRTREIGVRMALGAHPGGVLLMVIRNGMTLAAIGMGLGLAGAVVLSRLLRGQLFEVSPTDPLIYAGTAMLLAAVVLAASWLPARRAARVDPMVALRCE